MSGGTLKNLTKGERNDLINWLRDEIKVTAEYISGDSCTGIEFDGNIYSLIKMGNVYLKILGGGVKRVGEDFMIGLDSDFGKEIGFTSDKFEGWMWRKGEEIYISFIKSIEPNKGNLKSLINKILKRGFTVKVPTPMGLMALLVIKWGFKRTTEFWDETGEDGEVWVKKPRGSDGGG